MRFLAESPPLDLDPRLGEYLSRLEQRIRELERSIHDHDILYALPRFVKPGMVRWFADASLWPDPNDGGNQNQNGTNDGNGPGPNNGGTGGAAGLYQYTDYDTGWEPLF